MKREKRRGEKEAKYKRDGWKENEKGDQEPRKTRGMEWKRWSEERENVRK